MGHQYNSTWSKYIYIYIYVYIYICMYIYIYICAPVHKYIYIYIYWGTILIQIFTYWFTYVYIYVYIYIYTYIYVQVYKYIAIYTYTNMYTHHAYMRLYCVQPKLTLHSRRPPTALLPTSTKCASSCNYVSGSYQLFEVYSIEKMLILQATNTRLPQLNTLFHVLDIHIVIANIYIYIYI